MIWKKLNIVDEYFKEVNGFDCEVMWSDSLVSTLADMVFYTFTLCVHFVATLSFDSWYEKSLCVEEIILHSRLSKRNSSLSSSLSNYIRLIWLKR